MHLYLKNLLCCPECKDSLNWDIQKKTETRIMEATAICSSCNNSYGVHEGIGVFIVNKFDEADLWKEVDSNLMKAVSVDSEIEHNLLEKSLNSLNPADQFLRSMILDETLKYDEAKETASIAEKGIYTTEYLSCQKESIDYLINELKKDQSPILDIASGKGGLVEDFVTELTNPIILSDISPTVLRSNKKRFIHQDWYDRISLIAFDARNIPFKDQSLSIITTLHGLTNIHHTELFFTELSRILNLNGCFRAINFFFEETDELHRKETKNLNLNFSFKSQVKEIFEKTDLHIKFKNECKSFVKPTPESELFGIQIDSLPVNETTIEWNVVEVRKDTKN